MEDLPSSEEIATIATEIKDLQEGDFIFKAGEAHPVEKRNGKFGLQGVTCFGTVPNFGIPQGLDLLEFAKTFREWFLAK